MSPANDFTREKIFIRQLIFASKKIHSFSSKKKLMKERINALEEDYKKLKKKYPSKDLKRIKKKLDALKGRL